MANHVFKVALVKVYEIPGPADWGMIESFQTYIKANVPYASIDVFRPLKDPEHIPRRQDYDLIIITGGLVNLLATPPFDPWVDNILAMIRTIPKSKTKLLGICWGHQAVAHALSGTLMAYEVPRAGVQDIALTPEGKQFFQADTLKLAKFHTRAVQQPAAGFTALADDQEIFISECNQILTLQGHPEISGELSRQLFDGSYEYYSKGLQGEDGIAKFYAETPLSKDDADLIFKKTMTWAMDKEQI